MTLNCPGTENMAQGQIRSFPLNCCLRQVPAFQASPEGKTGCAGSSEEEEDEEGKQKSCQSCQEEKDPGMKQMLRP